MRDGCPPVGGERNPLEAEREQAMQSLIELHIRRLVVSRIDKGGGFLSLKGGCSARSRMRLRPRSDLERAP